MAETKSTKPEPKTASKSEAEPQESQVGPRVEEKDLPKSDTTDRNGLPVISFDDLDQFVDAIPGIAPAPDKKLGGK